MSLSRFDRKRADRFAEFVDSTTGPRTHRRTSVDDEVAPLSQLSRRLGAARLANLDEFAPDTDFKGALRSFLVATAQRDGLGSTASPRTRTAVATAIDTAAWQAVRPSDRALAGKTQPVRLVARRGPGRTRLAILGGVAAGAIILSGVSAASTGALPGDPLYSVKRSTERAQLALAGSDASRGKLYLEFARSRLAEASRVDPSRVGEVLVDMDLETKEGVMLLLNAAVASGDRAALTTITTFVAQQQSELGRLGQTVGSGLVTPSLTVLNKVANRVGEVERAMLASCRPTGADELGPKPDGSC